MREARDDPPYVAPPRKDVLRIGHHVLDRATEWLPMRFPGETPDKILYGTAYVARSLRLLAGMVALAEEGEDDAIGALYRVLTDVYLHGIYLFLGDDGAFDRLIRESHHYEHKLRVSIGQATRADRPETAKPLRTDKLARAVDSLMNALPSAPKTSDYVRRMYRFHYVITSYHDAHGGLGALTGYVSKDDKAVYGSRRDTETATFLLDMAVSSTLSMLSFWSWRTGNGGDEIADLMTEWEQLPGRTSPRPPP